MEERILLIGLGLIGGSIALAMKQEKDVVIYGYDINKDQMDVAKSLGVINETVETLESVVSSVDVIVLAAPVIETERCIEQLAKLPLKEGIIITDVGSTKTTIVQKAKECLPPYVTFIGGHPMAGSHKSGVVAARSYLFDNAIYILTPDIQTPSSKIDKLKDLLKGTKANFVILSPEEHDELVGLSSHLPHIVAAGLVHCLEQKQQEKPLLSRLAAGGFRDITRIASSSPVMWRDILLHNRDNLLTLVEDWQEEMDKVKNMLVMQDSEQIYHYFSEAKMFRDELPQKAKGAIPNFYDLYVYVEDYPGAISEVTSLLAKDQISIINLRIIETREDIMGVLRLTFRTEEDREKAQTILQCSMLETFVAP